MAQYNAPFSTASPPMAPADGAGILSGVPAVLTVAHMLVEQLPSIYSDAANAVLEEHVTDSRKFLTYDTEYSDLAGYYDVKQVDNGDEEGIELEFGFFNVPTNLHSQVSRLEYGDANHPPRAFVRRTVFKDVGDLLSRIHTKVEGTIGTGDINA